MTSAELKSPATSASPGNELPAASIVNLSKRFSTDVLAVDDVSLDVCKGAIFGLLEPNGAGKTTLLRMILGLIHPTKGQSFMFGKRLTPGSPLLKRVGSLVESPGFVPHLSGMGRRLIGRRALNLSRRRIWIKHSESPTSVPQFTARSAHTPKACSSA